MGISVCRVDLENTILHLQHGNIESPVTKNDRFLSTIETVSKDSGCRLVDHPEDLKASKLTSILSCLTLSVIEVCGHSNDSMAMDQLSLGLTGR